MLSSEHDRRSQRERESVQLFSLLAERAILLNQPQGSATGEASPAPRRDNSNQSEPVRCILVLNRSDDKWQQSIQMDSLLLVKPFMV